jgi:hypothetical protein
VKNARRLLTCTFLNLVLLGNSNAQDLNLWNIFESGERFDFDAFGASLSDAQFHTYQSTYARLASAHRVGAVKVCRVYGIEVACSRRTSQDLKLPRAILDRLSTDPTSPLGSVVLEGPLPPPVPYEVLNQSFLENDRPKFGSDVGRKQDNIRLFKDGKPKQTAFDENTARTAMRDFPWQDIVSFTSFAPEGAILFGVQVASLVRGLSDDDYSQTKCRGYCGRIIRRQGPRRTTYLLCNYHRFEDFSTPPSVCTLIGFEERGSSMWLRTRLLYNVIFEGAGPEESFRCESGMNTPDVLSKLKELLTSLEFRIISRPSPSQPGVTEMIASSLGRVSDVAQNRFEITNMTISIYDDKSWHKNDDDDKDRIPSTNITYSIPIYKLSPTRIRPLSDGVSLAPAAFDAGRTPSTAIIRAHEANLRLKLSQALNNAACDDKPSLW